MMTNHLYEGHYRDDSSNEECNDVSEMDGTRRMMMQQQHLNHQKSFDAVVFNVLKVAPEDFARQLTLLDFPVFRAIKPDEITCCGWTKNKEKNKLSPNVVAMTRRFNHTSFWVIREILNASTMKIRAEVLTHFIRIAKKLLELNNLHSLMAVTQSLNSSSIFRLTHTWALVAKHHKQSYERLLSLTKEDDNRSSLRAHMETIRLPCIPYLGMYLSDVMYINSAHPDTGGLESHERTNKMNNILRVIAEFQQSNYADLQEEPHIKIYLKSVKYIEELQKFLEEDNYKLSLKIEPAPSVASSTHLPDKKHSREEVTAKSLSKSEAARGLRSTVQTPPAPQRFVPGHRKSRSLGKEFAFTMQSQAALRPKSETSKIQKRRSLYGRPKSKLLHGSTLPPASSPPRHVVHDSGSLPRSALPLSTPPTMVTTSLLDDSIIHTPPSLASSSSSAARMSLAGGGGNSSSMGSSRSNSGSEFSEHDDSNSWTADRSLDISTEMSSCQFEGPLKRKCILKHGRKPAVNPWTKYWISLCGWQLLYFAAKTLRAQERHHFKSQPCKAVSIFGWMVLCPDDPTRHHDCFQLSNPENGNIYRFQCDTKEINLVWISYLKEAVKGRPQPEQDLIEFEER